MFRFILAAAILTLTPMISEAGGGSKQRTGSVKVNNPYGFSIPTAVVTVGQYDRLENLLSTGRFEDAEALFLSFGPQEIAGNASRVFSNLRPGKYYAVGDDGFVSFASSQFTIVVGQEAEATLVMFE